jgi:hypothetical protein
MTRISGVLARFWFAEAPAARLAMLRILIGAYAFWLTATHYNMWVGIGYESSPAVFAPVGVVGLLSHPLPGVVNHALLVAVLVANALFVLGWRHRVTGPVFALLWLWVLSYRQSWSMIYHSMNLPALHVLILGLAPAADAWSLDARRRARAVGFRKPADAWQYGFPIVLICAVTVAAYLVTGIAKVAGEVGWAWATGDVIRSQVASDAVRKEVLGDAGSPLFYVLYPHVWLFTIMGAMTYAVELGAPLALVHKRLAWLWAVTAFLMHWGILLVMGIKFPYHLSGIVFASFFSVERLVVLFGALRGRTAIRPAPVKPAGLEAVNVNRPATSEGLR